MTFYKKTLHDVPLGGKTVLLRTDYNVPLSKTGEITDDFRIRASLPTVRYLLKEGCKVVIITHLGRPDGVDPTLSLEPVAQRLAELLGESIRFVDQTIGEKARMAVKRAPKRSVVVLENLRFHNSEEANDMKFAHELARVSDAAYFVQDGFGVVHRDHASTAAITLCLPSVAGLLLKREYEQITNVMRQPKRPLIAVLGGAKVSDKIQVIEKFVNVADTILIGGAMANTFFAYKGIKLGKSKYEKDQDDVIKRIYRAVEKKVGKENVDSFLVLPSDVAVASTMDAHAKRRVIARNQVADDEMCLDIGDDTITAYTATLEKAAMVVWNGTLGYAELPAFAHGSARVAMTLAANQHITSIIGGGDTADFVLHWDGRQGASFSHVSTGGGASLELMAGKTLPGIDHLLDA